MSTATAPAPADAQPAPVVRTTSVTTIPTEHFRNAWKILKPAVSGKSTLPVLSTIKVEVSDDLLVCSATNLEINVLRQFPGIKTDRAWSACISADFFNQKPTPRGVRVLDTITLTLHWRNGVLEKIDAFRTGTNMTTRGLTFIDADEFPTFATAEGHLHDLTPLHEDTLYTALARVAGYAATDDSRPVLACVRLRIRDRALHISSADGFRLGWENIPLLTDESDLDCELIVPARAIAYLSYLAGIIDTDRLPVVIRDFAVSGQLHVRWPSTTVVSRLIDGHFPDLERIIPAKHNTRMVIDRDELRAALNAIRPSGRSAQFVLTMQPNDDRSLLLSYSLLSKEGTTELREMTVPLASVYFDPKPWSEKIPFSKDVAHSLTAAADYAPSTRKVVLNGWYLVDLLADWPTPQLSIAFTLVDAPLDYEDTGDGPALTKLFQENGGWFSDISRMAAVNWPFSEGEDLALRRAALGKTLSVYQRIGMVKVHNSGMIELLTPYAEISRPGKHNTGPVTFLPVGWPNKAGAVLMAMSTK